MKVLLSGFDPFGGEEINPSWEVVRSLPDSLKGHILVKTQLPTAFGESFHNLNSLWDRENPDIVLAVGQAGGRSGLSVERVAINLDDGRIPDNRGRQPVDSPITEDGPDGYFSNLPVKAMVRASIEAGIPASLSFSAGTFVCNHIMYRILHRINTGDSKIKGGFIHVPFLPDQAAGKGDVPSMSFESMRTGLLAMVEAVIAGKPDLNVPMGRIC
ncbi:pyroglutamyl-peptidase I [Spirochaeta isovalerica]|uniref:Pyrrolidone-carboxylate peptidase n=1 Tax=Spirochaeta isovalerica TaxID=150 RepID=A0A841R694_9SPIO|nr:pyroglutamyl-peptidase I [Spirochaeta isovalerica]MBB6480714.1 pyroglutamyl-peptidase [Spirochaeta isovalerica]